LEERHQPLIGKQLSSAPVAQGRTAEVYDWDSDHVLKLYLAWCPPDWVDYEARIARAVYEAGVPSPAAGEIVEVNGRRGLIYERLEGISMLQDLNARPWTFLKHARALAELHVKINQLSIEGLPSYKDGLRYSIRHTSHLSDDLRDKALRMLDALPDGRNVCHGDYHPGNVIITKQGLVAIDWMTAKAGSRWADVSRTKLLLSIGVKGVGRQVKLVVKILVGLFHRRYLTHYIALSPDSHEDMDRWMPITAAARLNEDIVPEREALIQMVKEG
jgi:tRNA A-37 threonylcarbamoyl transferase component Bud32